MKLERHALLTGLVVSGLLVGYYLLTHKPKPAPIPDSVKLTQCYDDVRAREGANVRDFRTCDTLYGSKP
jgi:hypothetical protein